MYEISLTAKSKLFAGVEILKELLFNAGVFPHQIAEYHQDGFCGVSAYLRNKQQITALTCKLKKFRIRGVSLRTKDISRRDWLNEFRRAVRPFAIARQFMVVPAERRDKNLPKNTAPIFIEMSLAFGTGLHETTQFMAQLIEECQGQYRDFLDVGTGSGILAILAARCGAKKIVALDVDPLAIRIARKNFLMNKARKIKIFEKDINKYSSRRQFDFVAANLYSRDLIRLRRKISSLVRTGKFLAVSGISRDHLKGFQKAYQKIALRCLRVCPGKQWCAILYQRMAE